MAILPTRPRYSAIGSMETVGLIDQKEKKARTVSGKDEKRRKRVL